MRWLAAFKLSVLAVAVGILLLREDPPQVIAIDGVRAASTPEPCVFGIELPQVEPVTPTADPFLRCQLEQAIERLHAADSESERDLWYRRVSWLEDRLEQQLRGHL